ncbi:MAG: hypothetical protein C0597_04695 [Marinilabiliales bacterium]|nr:MAG: hypothetical protein C0597_04695 [Marinilabiliales bacterium]
MLETLPENTRFKLDFYLSWPTYALDHSLDEHRYGRFLHTYIKLKPEEKPELFENSIKNLPELLMAEEEKRNEEINLFIQGLRDLHITDTSNYLWDWEVPTNTTYIYILAFTGLFILILSSLNYINLSTTRYTARQREIALRKTVGASKINLIIQFIGESILLVFIAHILGMFLLELSLPSLNNITQYSLKVVYSSAQLWFYLILIILFIGVGAGSYPAFYMSSFSPILIQRGGKHSKYRTNLRTILSTIQFTISIILIIGTAMISKQVNYMKNENLGFLKERKIIIELPSGHVNDENYLQIKNEFKKFTGIEGAAISSSVPGKWRYRWRLYPSGEEEINSQMINCMQADFDYFKIYGLKIEAGKAFDEDLSREANYGYVFNEAAIKKFGWETNEDALSNTLFERREPVLGVMKDFHSKGLQIDIEPLGIFLISEDYRYITLQMNELANYEKTVMFLQSKFGELFPDYVFNYFFLDEEFDRQYKSEEKIAKLFKLFAFIGIFIASIGLFGMSTFICQKREKEMAIRKVNGANTSQLFFELSKDFTWIVLIAFIIAIPIAYYGTNNWLNNFAYKVGISWFLILFSGALTWIVAMLTVSYQTVKTVRKNPVDSLRIE